MKLKKGCKVEVRNLDVLFGSWWSAEIISGNGHYYSVKFDEHPASMCSGIVKRVPRKAIRPCPPIICARWVPGDSVEVFSHGSWKPAKILSLTDGDDVSLMLLGSHETCKVESSNLRMRQIWEGGRWLVLGKESGNSDSNKLFAANAGHNLSCQRHVSLLEPKSDMPRGVKRRSEFSKPRGKKTSRVLGEDFLHSQTVAGRYSLLPEKVDAIVSQQKMLGKKYMHLSLNDDPGSFQMGTQKGNSNAYFAENLRLNDPLDDACSLASSSGSISTNMLHKHALTGPDLYLDDCADSQYLCASESGRRVSSVAQVDVAAEVHKVELLAYRSTMKALYASGPISWEQEEFITNLRMRLHISNDEHLLELKHLTAGRSH